MLVSKIPCGPNTNPYRPNANPNQPNANPNTSRWKMVIAGYERDGFTFGNSISDAVSGGIWGLVSCNRELERLRHGTSTFLKMYRAT